MSWKVDHGWFSNVNGVDVTKRDVGLSTTTYTYGNPRAVIFHYTAGCGSDISAVLKSRGISVTFSVDRDGKIYQYIPFGHAGWHAFSMSHYAIGVEHTALPGSCELTDVQLEASAKLMAAIVGYTKKHYGFSIPLKKLPAPVTLTNVQPGFFDHRDGDGSWNENGHTDHLYLWSWDKYLGAIKNVLNPPPMFQAILTKGKLTKDRTFKALADAIAFSRPLVAKGWKLVLRKK